MYYHCSTSLGSFVEEKEKGTKVPKSVNPKKKKKCNFEQLLARLSSAQLKCIYCTIISGNLIFDDGIFIKNQKLMGPTYFCSERTKKEWKKGRFMLAFQFYKLGHGYTGLNWTGFGGPHLLMAQLLKSKIITSQLVKMNYFILQFALTFDLFLNLYFWPHQ